MRKTRNHQGFTLIEMMTAIAILAILAAIAVPSYMSYRAKASAADIVATHEELQEIVIAQNASSQPDSCADVLQKISPSFLQGHPAELAVDFVSVPGGFKPVLRVCAEADSHGRYGVKAATIAHNVFAGEKIIETTPSPVLGKTMAIYAADLTSGNTPICTNYQPAPASGKGCGQTVAAPSPQPSAQPVSTPQPAPPKTQNTAAAAPSPPPAAAKSIPEVHRTYQLCRGNPAFCATRTEEKACPEDKPFAVNVITNHADGSRSVDRHCGSAGECFRDWYQGSSDKDRCMTFDPHFVLTLAFECTFCCTGKNCNQKLKPDEDTLVDYHTDGSLKNGAWQ